MKKSLKLGIAGLVILLAVVLMTEGVIFPKQLQPDVLPIRLISLTPGSSDSTAAFELENRSGSAVDVWAAATLHVGSEQQFDVREVQITPSRIDRNQSATITVNVPDDQRWQVMLRVARHGTDKGTIVFSDWLPD